MENQEEEEADDLIDEIDLNDIHFEYIPYYVLYIISYIIYNSQNRLTRSTSKKPTSAQIGPSRRMTLRADWIFADLVITIIAIFVIGHSWST